MLGFNQILKMTARFVMVASGKKNVHFFDDEAEAIEWLKSSDS